MKAYVLKTPEEQQALMDIVNALTDEQKELVVKFGGEMYTNGLVDGAKTFAKGAAIGCVVVAAVNVGLLVRKARKQKKELEEN